MKAKKMKNTPNSILRWILWTILVAYTITMLLPFAWALLTSLKSGAEYTLYENIIGWPKNFSFAAIMENYKTAWAQGYVAADVNGQKLYFTIPNQFINSLIYSGGCMVTATITPCLTAYVTARYNYKFSKFVYAIVIVAMILPIVGSLPSEIEMTRNLGTFDTFWGLWIQKANFLGPYFLIFFAQFKMIPMEYTEAARIDGASEFYAMSRVVLPLAKSTIGTVALLNFVTFWNDYQIPMMFLPSKPVLAYGMYYFSLRNDLAVSSIPTQISYMIVVIIPILILFLIAHKRLMGNISMGGLKG